MKTTVNLVARVTICLSGISYDLPTFAQALPVLPPIPEGLSSPMVPRMEACDTIQCDVAPPLLQALNAAQKLYSADAMAAKTYSAVLEMEGGNPTITLIPSPLGTKGRAITYVFDATGKLKHSYIIR